MDAEAGRQGEHEPRAPRPRERGATSFPSLRALPPLLPSLPTVFPREHTSPARPQLYSYLSVYKSIPAFTAGITLDAFERSTISAAPMGGGGGAGAR